MKDKILILGGNGFIGVHLIRRLKDIGYDCFSLSLKKIKEKSKEDNIYFLNANLADLSEVKKVLENRHFDYVVNLSGYIDHSDFFNGGVDVLNTHFGGLLNILKIIDLKNLKKIVQIGSSDEYGNLSSPQNEEMREDPVTPYALAKLSCTNLLQMLHKTQKLPIVILRLFLVYGEGQSLNRFLPQIINGCLNKQEFATSHGNQIRDFCYVSDIVDGIIATLDSDQVNGHILNLASGKPVLIKTVIEKIVSSIGSGEPQFGKIKYRLHENMSLYANISKAQKLISWKPKIDLDDGLKKTIKYYANRIK
ncbi:NAD-dependent epimerase/dehydratase family protein [Prochlorococcus sp. AH-716-E13]|nr:NAD-dependent epimerase/dehydratase family protein [Prochlorococcus sp. AH-716-E13]